MCKLTVQEGRYRPVRSAAVLHTYRDAIRPGTGRPHTPIPGFTSENSVRRPSGYAIGMYPASTLR